MGSDEETIGRINKDIEIFKTNIKEIESLDLNPNEKNVVERAKSYFEDTTYFLQKKDLVTSFGCITYAHGLLDSIRLIHDII
ncbi:MAG: DUF357 domain-containing protein [Methanobacterium sp.]